MSSPNQRAFPIPHKPPPISQGTKINVKRPLRQDFNIPPRDARRINGTNVPTPNQK